MSPRRWMQRIHSFAVRLLSQLKSNRTASPVDRTLSAIHTCPCHVRLARSEDAAAIVRFVERELLHREPLVRALGVGAIPQCRAQLLDHVRRTLRDSFTLLATAPGPDRLVGVAIGRRSCAWDGRHLTERADRTQCAQLRKLLYIWSIVAAEPALHQHFCTRCLFEIAFLATAADAQRMGIGLHLTRHSLQLARALGYHHARMNCTGEYSSRIATKAGLECHWTVAYRHLVDGSEQPVVHPEPPHTHIKVHATALFPGLSIKSSCR
uniref:N-acetyltransferase domain-containing protein n=1 Tax=Anopheles dirus TaxID=7168 RepID=A0A182NV96_9DIPT